MSAVWGFDERKDANAMAESGESFRLSADKPKLFYIAFVITIGLKKRILNRVCPTEAVVGGRHRIFLFYDTPEITESIVDFFGFKMDL